MLQVVLGQDQRQLGALIVPSKEAFEELASSRGGSCQRLLVLSLILPHLML